MSNPQKHSKKMFESSRIVNIDRGGTIVTIQIAVTATGFLHYLYFLKTNTDTTLLPVVHLHTQILLYNQACWIKTTYLFFVHFDHHNRSIVERPVLCLVNNDEMQKFVRGIDLVKSHEAIILPFRGHCFHNRQTSDLWQVITDLLKICQHFL